MGAVNTAARPARPGHVTAAGVILYIEAALTVLALAGVHLGSAMFGAAILTRQLLVDAVLLALTIATGTLAYHVLRGKPWARTAVTVWSVVAIITGTVLMLGLRVALDAGPGEPFITVHRLDREAAGSGLWINVLLIVLLHTEPARRYFQRVP